MGPNYGATQYAAGSVLTVDHIGNPAPGIWVPDKSGQGQVFAGCGAIKKKWTLLNQVAKERTATWTTILHRATITKSCF